MLFFCGQPAMAGNKRKGFDVISVRTIKLKDIVLRVCQERNDSWAHSVLARISSAHDLHAADAIYHKACDINFRTLRQIPTAFRKEKLCTKKVKLGRPEELDRTEAFLEVAKFLEENDDEQITISDLISKMEVILEYSTYSRVHWRSYCYNISMESPMSLHSEILLRLFYRTSTTVHKSLILAQKR